MTKGDGCLQAGLSAFLRLAWRGKRGHYRSSTGQKLLDDAIEVIEKYFWSEDEQMCLESWDEAFSQTEDYRGGNANMHAVEAFLIVYDVTHDRKWLDRALRIASVIIHDVARSGEYRVNEHFDSQWNPIRDYNKDNPAHRFRAYGGTPGHWIEWGRLMLHLHAALEARFETPPAWLLEDAKGLFHATIRDAWAPDGGRLCLFSGLANRSFAKECAGR
jgi:sulfoquinovose isomerase